jgi:hypothetical protein
MVLPEGGAVVKKIVFVAIVGFTGLQTTDGRVLIAPEKYLAIRHSDYPLPVCLGENDKQVTIGTVDQVALCDRRIITFGHLSEDVLRLDEIKALATGYYHLVPILDEVEIQKIDPEDQHLYDMTVKRLIDWRVCGLRMVPEYSTPWTAMPHAVIEELNFTREELINA